MNIDIRHKRIEEKEDGKKMKKVKKRNYLIELYSWKKAHSCTTCSKSITLNKSMVNLLNE